MTIRPDILGMIRKEKELRRRKTRRAHLYTKSFGCFSSRSTSKPPAIFTDKKIENAGSLLCKLPKIRVEDILKKVGKWFASKLFRGKERK